MKKPLFTVFTFCTTILYQFLLAQPSIQWQKTLGGSDDDGAYAVKQTHDKGFIVAGYTLSNDGDVSGNHGNEDYWIVKLDSNGNLLWQKALGGNKTDIAYTIYPTADGGYAAAGWSYSTDGDVSGHHGAGDYWVLKLDSDGNLLWQKSYGGSDEDWAESIQQTSDGGYIVAGRSKSDDGDVTGNHGANDFWIIKLDSGGNLVWQKALGGSEYDDATSIEQTSDGGYVAVGWSESTNGDVTGNHGWYDYWIVKLDSAGTLSWEKSYGGTIFDQPYAVQQTTDGGFIINGFSFSNDGDVSGNHGAHDYWPVKLDADGNLEWQKCYGGTTVDRGKAVAQTSDGGYLLGGWASSNNGNVTGNHGADDYWIVKLDNNGNLVWQKCYGGSNTDWAYSLQQISDGSIIVGGATYSNNNDVSGNHGGADFWIIKLSCPGSTFYADADSDGFGDAANSLTACLLPNGYVSDSTDCNDGDPNINPAALEIENGIDDNCNNVIDEGYLNVGTLNTLFHVTIFPNPAEKVIFIDLGAAPVSADVQIYDLQGRLVSPSLQMFNNSVGINIEWLNQGLYTLKISDKKNGLTNYALFVKAD